MERQDDAEGRAGASGCAGRVLFGAAIFLAALLLFQLQPLIARFILPWFGGSPAVWTTCMLFFQSMLLAGYAFAHLVASRLPVGVQAGVQLLLLAVAAASLSIVPGGSMAPAAGASPVLEILSLLLLTVGLPYTLLTTASPLLQRWFTQLWPGRSPYPLYALSNTGSLIGLLSYPFVVEPLLARPEQARLWQGLFVVEAVVFAGCAVLLWRRRCAPGGGEPLHDAGGSPPRALDRVLWLALPAVASLLLLAFTNQLCRDVAAMPFLWVLPLALYLSSFILAFSGGRWYRRVPYALLLLVALEGAWALLLGGRSVALWLQLGGYCGALFVCAMVCHGELYHRRPGPSQLTAYYLMIAAGGALGGLFAAVLAPLLFTGFFELHLGLVATGVLALVAYRRPGAGAGDRLPGWALTGGAVLLPVLALMLGLEAAGEGRDVVTSARSFHGVLRVVEADAGDPMWHRLVLMDGRTEHGFQFMAPARAELPVAYYGPRSGAGVALAALADDGGRRVGLVGLGAGVLAAWGRPGDVFRFFELNPDVIRLARSRFSYLARSRARVEVEEGDGRLLLTGAPDASLDLLVLDAFSSDAIPVHLLTGEAFAVYRRVLDRDGVLAAHLTNRHMDLVPVALRLAADWQPRPELFVLRAPRDDTTGEYSSTYVVASYHPAVSAAVAAAGGVRPDLEQLAGRRWSDDFSSPLEVLSWR